MTSIQDSSPYVKAQPQHSVPDARSQRFYHPEIDILRFFAFIMVFFHHALPQDAQTYLNAGLSKEASVSCGYELISETDHLQEFPVLGRIVPEYRSDNIREILFRPYRIVYRVDHGRKICQIACFLAFSPRNTVVGSTRSKYQPTEPSSLWLSYKKHVPSPASFVNLSSIAELIPVLICSHRFIEIQRY